MISWESPGGLESWSPALGCPREVLENGGEPYWEPEPIWIFTYPKQFSSQATQMCELSLHFCFITLQNEIRTQLYLNLNQRLLFTDSLWCPHSKTTKLFHTEIILAALEDCARIRLRVKQSVEPSHWGWLVVVAGLIPLFNKHFGKLLNRPCQVTDL